MLPARYLELITLVFHCLRLDNWCAVVMLLSSDSFRASCQWINHKADSSDLVLNIQRVIFDECQGSSEWCSRSE